MAKNPGQHPQRPTAAQRRLRREIGVEIVAIGTEWAKELIDRAAVFSEEQKHRAELSGVAAPEGTLGYEVLRVMLQQLLANGFVALREKTARGSMQWIHKLLVECGLEITDKLKVTEVLFGMELKAKGDIDTTKGPTLLLP